MHGRMRRRPCFPFFLLLDDGKQPLGGVELRIVSLTFRPLGLTACSARLGVLAVLPEQRVH